MKITNDWAINIAKQSLDYCLKESCGKCVPCRIGSKRAAEIMARIENGEGEPQDLETLERLCKYMTTTSACGMGQATGNMVLSMLPHLCQNDTAE